MLNNTFLEEMVAKIKEGRAEVTSADYALIDSYDQSQQKGFALIVVDKMVWEDELDNFISLLRKADIKTFILAEYGSSSFFALHRFSEEGFKFKAVTIKEPLIKRQESLIKGFEIEVI